MSYSLSFPWTAVFLSFLLGSGCSSSKTARTASTGMVRYAIELDLNEQGQAMAETFGEKATAWFNKDYVRFQKDSNVPGEEFYITDLKDRGERAYVQFKEKKFAILNDPRMLPDTGPIRFSEEKKTVAGFECRKATAKMGSGEMEVYFSEDFPINYCPYLDLAGFALEYTLVMPFGKVTYRASEVKLEPIPNALINPPAGFQEVTFAEFQEAVRPRIAEGSGKSYQFQKKDLGGNTVRLSDLQGQVVVLNFWFTECPPCKAEIPHLNRLVESYAGEEVRFLAITFDPAQKVQPFLDRHPFQFRIIPDAHDVIRDFEIIVYPTTIVLDKEGKIVNTLMGGSSTIEADIRELIEQARKS